jgi:hypothetical protein
MPTIRADAPHPDSYRPDLPLLSELAEDDVENNAHYDRGYEDGVRDGKVEAEDEAADEIAVLSSKLATAEDEITALRAQLPKSA